MYRCTVCHSDDVDEKMWVCMNTLKLSPEASTGGELEDSEDHYCNDCNANVGVYEDESVEITPEIVGGRISHIINVVKEGEELSDGEVVDLIVEYLKSKDIYHEQK